MVLFLFFIIVEGLAWMARQTTKTKLFEGVKIGKNEIKINILQPLDDIYGSAFKVL